MGMDCFNAAKIGPAKRRSEDLLMIAGCVLENDRRKIQAIKTPM
jgi:hypothetical protein